MNYTPQEKISNTSCKDCTFAIYDGNTQTGCKDNRIIKFKDDIIEAYDNDKEFFVIKRLCTLYRTKEWNEGIADIEKAKNESQVTFDLLINCDNIDIEMYEYINALLSTLHSKIQIKLFYSYKSSLETKNQLKNLFYNHPSITVSMYFDKKEYIYLNVMKSSSMFHVLLDETNYLDIEKFLYKINEYITEDMRKAIIFKRNNQTAILSLICRTLFPNLYLDYDNEYLNMEKQTREEGLYIEL